MADRGRRAWLLLLVPAVALTMAAVALPASRMEVAGAGSQEQQPAAVRRPLHNMVEGYAEGQVVAIEYLSTFYCPTTPSSDLDGPFGHGSGRPQSEDPRVAKVFDDPSRQPPDPIIGGQHSHLLPETSAAPGWWNIRGVAIYDRSIWPDRDGNCPAGPPSCVTSLAAMRAAQQRGQASVELPSNAYWYMAVHPEEP